jgi:muramoyltetrapeptide carboxypeptidase
MDTTRRNFIPALGALILSPTLLSFKEDQNLLPIKIKPKALRKGDLVGICASAGASHDLKEVDNFVTVLQSFGFKVKEGPNVRTKHGYFSANDQERAEELMGMIKDPKVKAIFFTRGGWGCARILAFLDFEIIRQNPKVIMGFSDISSLLNAITLKTGLTTFHGPNGNASWNDFSWQSINALLCEAKILEYKKYDDELYEDKPLTIVRGQAKGELWGGNLTVLTGLLGTTFVPDWTNKILFFEDVLEEPYAIDRMLTQWKMNGVFDQVKGIVLGQFRKCKAEEPMFSFTLLEVFMQHFSDLKIPVIFGFPLGHIRNKYTLPIGEIALLDADQFTLSLIESAVI